MGHLPRNANWRWQKFCRNMSFKLKKVVVFLKTFCFIFLFISDRDWIPRVDERDQTVIPAGAGHDARGRENHELRSSLHHAIQQRRKRSRHAMKHPFSRTYPVMYIHTETEKSSLNKPYGYWSCTVERDVENRRYMIGTATVHHLSWPVFRHAKYHW